MWTQAASPEELERLFEDATVVGDAARVAGLFEPGALLASVGRPVCARGATAIGRVAAQWFAAEHAYVAANAYVLQARDMALLVGSRGITVARQGPDGWRYAIALLSDPDKTKGVPDDRDDDTPYLRGR